MENESFYADFFLYYCFILSSVKVYRIDSIDAFCTYKFSDKKEKLVEIPRI